MLLSIIIPVYKVEKYLDTCVKSVLDQAFNDYEIILVDDGSPDNCPQICDRWVKKDRRIKVIHKENGGLSDARNAGIAIAQGDYLFFLDSDDSILHSSLDSAMDVIKKLSPQVLINLYRAQDDESGLILFGPDSDFSNLEGIYSSDDVCEIYKKQNVSPCAWRYMVKREIIAQNNLFFEKGILSEDALWTPQLITICTSFAFNPKMLYNYLVREGSIMTSFNFKRVTDILKICQANFELSKNKTKPQQDFINNLNFLIVADNLKSYPQLNRQQKMILNQWFSANKCLTSKMLESRKEIWVTSKFLGAKNAIRLVAFAIKTKAKTVNLLKDKRQR